MQPEDEDAYWRRPDPGAEQPPSDTSSAPQPLMPPVSGGHVVYPGPPPMSPPPTGWTPANVVEPPPPRQLPPQDHARIDEEESQARAITVGVGMVAAAVMLVALCAICGRLFSLAG